MLCSISAPKPNSSWLDRLRSSKGFPVSSDLENLDQFLSSNRNPNPNPVPKRPPRSPNEKDHNLFDLMSNVLSDLFVMGSPPNRPNPQKASRKQPKPRICNGGGSSVGGNREVSPSSVNNCVTEGKKRKLKVRKRSEGGLKDSDLAGFSRTEVTVIDTSLLPDWKAARVLYRKGLVWKVREKKVVRVGRKKRRRVGSGEKPRSGNERKGDAGEAKGSSFQRAHLALLDKGSTQTDKREESKETDDQTLIPRRPKFSRSPRIPAKNTSPVLHLKIISNKNGATGPRNILKGKQCRIKEF